MGWFSSDTREYEMGLNIQVGDHVTSKDHVLAFYFWRGSSKVIHVREVNGPEGNAVTCENQYNEFWSKYLRKC
jgi:hypothetical protein